MVSISAPSTMSSASALERKKRVRWCRLAPIALKKMKRAHARGLRRAQQPVGAQGVDLLEPHRGLVTDRRGEVDHGVGAAHRVAQAARVGEVGERELHPDAVGPEPLRLTNQAANLVALGQELSEQR